MMDVTTARGCILSALFLASLPGCYSGLDLDGGADDAAGSSGGSGPNGEGDDGASGGPGGGSDGGNGGNGDPGAEELPAPSARLYRLTHTQWENAVRDLLYLAEPTGFSEILRADPISGGYAFDNNGQALEVDPVLWSGYQRAAASVAELAASDSEIMAALLPPDAGDEAARARSFVEEFGRRAFRRPLTEDQVDAYVAQFLSADAMYPEDDAATSGVRLVLETMLQSPSFLYRIETSTESADGAMISLSGWELASRMSFFLWNTIPDDALLDAAEAGNLATEAGVREIAVQMLDEPEAAEVLTRFHDQLFDVDRVLSASPSDVFYPDVDPQFGQYAAEEVDLFVRDVFAHDGGLTELLTSTETFVNAELARIYGIDGTYDETFVRATLNPEERKGILTRVQFLAANATSVHPDPIHRGVYVAKHITCAPLPAPPDVFDPLPVPDGETNREVVEGHTQVEGTNCAGCHDLINPFGFPYENYDAVGAFRVKDGEFDVDPASEVMLDGDMIAVANALELSDVLAGSPSVHKCYAKHWVEFSAGRPSVAEDDPLVERLAASSLAEGASLKNILVELVTSQPFRTRAVQELP